MLPSFSCLGVRRPDDRDHRNALKFKRNDWCRGHSSACACRRIGVLRNRRAANGRTATERACRSHQAVDDIACKNGNASSPTPSAAIPHWGSSVGLSAGAAPTCITLGFSSGTMPTPDDPAPLLGNDRRGCDLIRGERGGHDDPRGVWRPRRARKFPVGPRAGGGQGIEARAADSPAS